MSAVWSVINDVQSFFIYFSWLKSCQSSLTFVCAPTKTLDRKKENKLLPSLSWGESSNSFCRHQRYKSGNGKIDWKGLFDGSTLSLSLWTRLAETVWWGILFKTRAFGQSRSDWTQIILSIKRCRIATLRNPRASLLYMKLPLKTL